MRLSLPALLCVALAALSSSCCCDDDDDGGGDCCGGGIVTFVESEPNDDPLTANHFGVLEAGDQLVIEGFVRDDLADPFDGFAFTAGHPLHVDFELFIDNALADLDVCLYDPQIDQTVSCFTSTANPELGGVDVFAGGLDFHLVVESFDQDATYSMVVTVFSLQREPLRDADAPTIQAVGAGGERVGACESGYKKPAPAPLLVLERVLDFDEQSGIVIERRRLLER